MARSDVVISGIGTVGAWGTGRGPLWDHVLAGAPPSPDGRVPGFDGAPGVSRREARRLDRVAHLGLAAAQEALEGARTPDGGPTMGVVMGSAYGGVTTMHEQTVNWANEGPRAVSPVMGAMIPVSAVAVEVGLLAGATGPAIGLSATCATGTEAIGHGTRLIRDEACEVVLAGAAESPFTPVIERAFTRLNVVSQSGRSRPFDIRRDGFVTTEGSAVFVLESAAHAERRGAEALGRITGAASALDHEATFAPSPTGGALAACIERALDDAGISPDSVAHVNAHGTGTPANDAAEAHAVRDVLGSNCPVLSVKGSVGHAGGAAGAIEAAVVVEAMRQGKLPPTAGCEQPDPDFGIDLVTSARTWGPGPSLSISVGLGGHLAVLVLEPAR